MGEPGTLPFVGKLVDERMEKNSSSSSEVGEGASRGMVGCNGSACGLLFGLDLKEEIVDFELELRSLLSGLRFKSRGSTGSESSELLVIQEIKVRQVFGIDQHT